MDKTTDKTTYVWDHRNLSGEVRRTPAEPSPTVELPPSWLKRKYIRWSIKLKAIFVIIKSR